MVTYGDGVANINVQEIVDQFYDTYPIGIISTYNYQQNKGVVDVSDDNKILAFREKSEADSKLINIGYMVFNPYVFEYLTDDTTILEKDCLPKLAAAGQLEAYHHDGFW
jgi:glucose-1-phosphate cytidylyltransferase